ncbi:hypothetical protein [Microbacterium murale]|uniref:DUF4878 domain-containing protein n=1 Tax=Microbacterium murale TaxID=1081040 RepID=A0ABU0PC13_9MICO|nr:hypothetical protein [Microbacterium murale]MDQ0644868.1 hypothetical protein [Microbacterium murale]
MNAQAAKRRAPWIIGGAIAAALLIAAAIVWFLIPRGSPEDQALAYLQALADGDVAAVEATGVDIPAATASAFAAASDHLTQGTVESSTADDDAAAVVVSFELAGARHESTLSLSRLEGRWVPEAAAALGSVQFSVPVSVDDTMLPSDEKALLLPAVYDVNAVPTSFLDGSATVEVIPGGSQEVDVDAILRPEATVTAQTQLDEYLATCTAPAPAPPSSCGIVIPWAADFTAVSEIRYRIDQTPTVALTPTAFRADGGALTATVTGTAPDGAAKTLTYRTASWSVRGEVTFTDDDVVLSVW